MLGGKIKVDKDDFNKLSDLAKKQISSENNENELSEKVELLTKENEELSNQNRTLKIKLSEACERNTYLNNELNKFKVKLEKVMKFIDELGLKQKLDEFLKPIAHRKSR